MKFEPDKLDKINKQRELRLQKLKNEHTNSIFVGLCLLILCMIVLVRGINTITESVKEMPPLITIESGDVSLGGYKILDNKDNK